MIQKKSQKLQSRTSQKLSQKPTTSPFVTNGSCGWADVPRAGRGCTGFASNARWQAGGRTPPADGWGVPDPPRTPARRRTGNVRLILREAPVTSTSPSTRPPAAAIDTPPAATPSGATATRPGGRPLRVVRAKLRPAPSPSGLLRRPRLHSLIEDCTGTPLTLVLAPAGSGKTSLLACWAADTACPSAWLTLDEADREPAAFWAGIVAALQRLRPHCGEATLALLRQPGPRRAAVDALLDELESLPGEPAVLVLDNFHLVDGEPALVDLVSSFTEHLPSWLSVVLLTRRLPPMPLARLRGQGRLRELHFSELRFSAQESRDMLTLLLPDLAPAQTEQIVTRAEGWAAGLGLTALAERARRARPDEFAAGVADQAVGHYAWREILAAGRPEVVDLLAAAAVVPRVHVGLAAALSGRPDAHDLLAEAEAQGLFVHRIGDTDSYEIHALVRAALLAQLGRRSPARLEELRVAAADWYESQGDCVAAIEQCRCDGVNCGGWTRAARNSRRQRAPA